MTKRTKALDISPIVRAEVYERDSFDGHPCCVISGKPYNLTIAHYIARSQSGLGIPMNLVTLSMDVHERFDHGRPNERKQLKRQIREYLIYRYGDLWNEEDLVYKREG